MGKIIIENICEGGAGQEARVLVQARNLFPGLGGAILSEQLVASALRINYSGLPGSGTRLFLKHLLIKKLDDFFCRTGAYFFPHVTRPLGNEDSSYLYEWVYGTDAFSWKMCNENVDIKEWSEFVSAFDMAGIPMNIDVVAPEGEISQNIIHQLYRREAKLNGFWKRIDFGECSLHLDYEKLGKFIFEKAYELEAVLGTGRYKLLKYAYKYLSSKIGRGDMRKLESLSKNYRISTLRHHRPKVVIT